MGNVKHTTNNGEILSTECKKMSTAFRRFSAFLKDYDSIYSEMLSELNENTTTFKCSSWDTETITISLTHDNTTYTLTIKHGKEPDNKATDNKEPDSKESDIKEPDSKESDIKEPDSKESDIKEPDSKESDNKGYMKCEYFFSLDPKLPPKCKYCIYSERDFCPADGEKYWGICEE